MKAVGRDARMGVWLRERWPRPAWTLAPAIAILGAVLVAPLLVFFLYSFWSTTPNGDIVYNWSLGNYVEISANSSYSSLFINTLTIALSVSVVTTALACAVAVVLRFKLSGMQDTVVLLMTIALFSGYLVRIYAWRALLGREGIINGFLQGIGVIQEPWTFLIFSRFTVILVLCNFLLPLVVLPIYAALQNVQDDVIEASRDLGAGSVATLWRITLPLIRNGLFSAFAIAFIIAAGDYVTPTLVGGVSGSMIGRTIAGTFGTLFNWPLGSALSVVMLSVVVGCLAVVSFAMRRVLK